MPTWARLFFLAPLLLPACRATNPAQDSALESVADKPWFDTYGDLVVCEIPPNGCAKNTYDKDFVDQCVAKGFQAKSCGCTAGCSGQLEAKPKPVDPSGPGLNARDCPSEASEFITKAAKAQGAAGRCYEDSVCNGDQTSCNETEKKLSAQLRGLARAQCHRQVFAALCGKGAKDTLGCDEGSIDTIGNVYTKAFDKTQTLFRRCVRDRFCNKTSHGCTEANLNETTAAAQALTKTGCSYWLASICSIDGK